jgi:hypothetical protein
MPMRLIGKTCKFVGTNHRGMTITAPNASRTPNR